MLQHHPDDAGGGGGEVAVLVGPGAAARSAPEHEAGALAEARIARAGEHLQAAFVGAADRGEALAREEVERGGERGPDLGPALVAQHGVRLVGERVEQGRAIGPQRLHEGFEDGLHHARRQHLLAHLPEDVVHHLAAAELGGDRGVVGVLLGDVDAGAACADDAAFLVGERGGGEGDAGLAAVLPHQPGAAAALQRARRERVERGVVAVHEQVVRGLAQQHGGAPAERRVGRQEHEAPLGIGLEDEVAGDRGDVAPALPAVQQGVAQRIFLADPRDPRSERSGDEAAHVPAVLLVGRACRERVNGRLPATESARFGRRRASVDRPRPAAHRPPRPRDGNPPND